MSNHKATLVVLAAGMGSRYGGLKQVDPVGPNGEAILDYSVYDAFRAGFTKVVFIIRKEFENEFRTKITEKYNNKIEVAFVYQDINSLPDGFTVPEGRDKPWGTAHAMLAAQDKIDGPFAIINADDFYGQDSYKTLFSFLTSNNICQNQHEEPKRFAMVGFKLSNTLSENGSVARGICKANKDGSLTQVEELVSILKTQDGAENREEDGSVRKLTGDEPVSMNMWAFTPHIFQLLNQQFKDWLIDNINVEKSECFIPVEVDKMIKSNKVTVKVLKTDSKWFGVTYKEDKPYVQSKIKKLIAEGKYPEKLFE